MRHISTLLLSVSCLLNCSTGLAATSVPSPYDVLGDIASAQYMNDKKIELDTGEVQTPLLRDALQKTHKLHVIPFQWPYGNEYVQKLYVRCDIPYKLAWAASVTDDQKPRLNTLSLMAQGPKGWIQFFGNAGKVRGRVFYPAPTYNDPKGINQDVLSYGETSFTVVFPSSSGACKVSNLDGKQVKTALLHALLIQTNEQRAIDYPNSLVLLSALK